MGFKHSSVVRHFHCLMAFNGILAPLNENKNNNGLHAVSVHLSSKENSGKTDQL